jgi:hypothetical protein
MIEYLHNSIRATAGSPAKIEVRIVGATAEAPHLMLFDDVELLGTYMGEFSVATGTWLFVIPADDTNRRGRFWYCICEKENKLCFKQPIYFE